MGSHGEASGGLVELWQGALGALCVRTLQRALEVLSAGGLGWAPGGLGRGSRRLGEEASGEPCGWCGWCGWWGLRVKG